MVREALALSSLDYVNARGLVHLLDVWADTLVSSIRGVDRLLEVLLGPISDPYSKRG